MEKQVRIEPMLQVQKTESGSTCLAMLAGYYGKWITLIKASELCAVDKDGCRLEQMAQGAAKLGMDAEVREADFKDLKRFAEPVIVRFDDYNYVVLEAIYGSKVSIISPEYGRIKMPVEEFQRKYSGEALIMHPGKDFEKGGRKINPFVVALRVMKNAGRGRVVKYGLVLALSSLMFIIYPFLNNFYVDTVLPQKEVFGKTFAIIYGILLVVTIFLEILNVIQYTDYFGNVVMNNSRHFMWNLLNLPNYYFDRRSRSYFLNCCKENEVVCLSLSTQVLEIIFKIAMLIICIVAMLFISWEMTLAILLMVGLTYLLLDRFTRKQQGVFQKLYCADNAQSTFLLDGLESLDNIRNACAEYAFFGTFTGLNLDRVISNNEFMKGTAVINNVPKLMADITKMILITTGAILVIKGRFTFGAIVAVQGIFGLMADPILKVSQSVADLLSTRYSLMNLEEIRMSGEENLEKKHSTEYNGETESSEDVKKLSGDIEVNNITFGYNPYRKALFRDFSMSIKPGECIGIVGLSGCGKSTLKNLISGRLEPWSGEVLYDGKHKDEIPVELFCSSIASVDQNIMLFPDTVSNNIKMWDDSIEPYEVILSAKDAEIYDVVMNRAKGLQTVIKSKGANFSGGERQRIEIARALAQDPTVLILDEATSALDTIVEKKIAETIKKQGRTMIIIAHRLSTIKLCDCIYVLNHGELVDKGTHEELMKRCDIYNELVTVE